MPIQAPQWTDYLNCPACCREFAPPRSPVSLGCGHTLCKLCLKNLHRKQCPFDQTSITLDLEELVVNTAILQLAGFTPPSQPYHPPCIKSLSEPDRRAYDDIIKCLEQLAVFLKYSSVNMMGTRLSRPMQRKLVTLLQCAVTDGDGRGKAARAARSLGERTVTELILQHQNPQHLSANLWAAVRSRGCQFLGPAMQEEVLKLVLLALEDGSALSRKVLVMFVVQRLEPHFPQASKTSIGHVVQLLYRASCFKVSKRERDSSLMQLKEEFRSYESLRREHDAQMVQIANESGLRIAPDQWSALLYGDTQHKSHMQSIIDKLQTPQSFSQSVQELIFSHQKSGETVELTEMGVSLDRLVYIDSSVDAKSPTWQQLAEIMKSLKDVVSWLVQRLERQFAKRDVTQNTRVAQPSPEPPSQQSLAHAGLPPMKAYKALMCRDATAGKYCPRGVSCTYAHSAEEIESCCYYCCRYRRINHAIRHGNYSFLLSLPVVPVSEPIKQRFTVPPPPLPNLDTYIRPVQQTSSCTPLLGAEATERDATFYDQPPPSAATDKRVASYASVVINGTSQGKAAPVAPTKESQEISGNPKMTLEQQPGCYYPFHMPVQETHPTYMLNVEGGHINNGSGLKEDLSQYAGPLNVPKMSQYSGPLDVPKMSQYAGPLNVPKMSQYSGPLDVPKMSQYSGPLNGPEMSQCSGMSGPQNGPEKNMSEYPQAFNGNNADRHADSFFYGMPSAKSESVWATANNALPLYNYEMQNNGPVNMLTNGGIYPSGVRMASRRDQAAPANTPTRDEQDLERELRALEKRIYSEFSDHCDSDEQ